MATFGYMKVHCPICMIEIDGMKAYGRESACCDAECYGEWQWRRTLAIMGKRYEPKPGSRWDPNGPTGCTGEDFAKAYEPKGGA